jgi:5-dehydro-2-deoxygluconokinase
MIDKGEFHVRCQGEIRNGPVPPRTQDLYLLPFDHRRPFITEVFGFRDPLASAQVAEVQAVKRVIYDGFRAALDAGVPAQGAGILVDEEFGAAILRDAAGRGYVTALPVEVSAQREFQFQYGEEFAAHIQKFRPTYVKALVRYNPEGDRELNRRQAERLRRLSELCMRSGRKFMFELIVPPEPGQLERAGGERGEYERSALAELIVRAVEELQDAEVEPEVWKLEGLERAGDCERVARAIRRGGRDHAGAIVLGRGEDARRVEAWLTAAAAVPAYLGLAVGRSTFLEPIVELRRGTLSREAAVTRIAERYRGWVEVFRGARLEGPIS